MQPGAIVLVFSLYLLYTLLSPMGPEISGLSGCLFHHSQWSHITGVNCVCSSSLFFFAFYRLCHAKCSRCTGILHIILYIYTHVCTRLHSWMLDNMQLSHCVATGAGMMSRTIWRTIPKSPVFRLMNYHTYNVSRTIGYTWLHTQKHW